MSPATPELPLKPKPERDPPEPPPDFAEEAAPKSSEFGTKKHAKELTGGGFDLIP
jgi:hypothetical protein